VRRQIRTCMAAACLALVSCLAGSMTTGAGMSSDIIGENKYYQVKEGDTLLEIARLHDLGFIELVSANPGVDPWIPEAGRTILLPTQHILPDGPRRGIVINRTELRLYYFDDRAGETITYPIGIGREGRETPLGSTTIAAKRVNPTWTPPPSIRAERPELPVTMPPGPENPLGFFAMNLGWQNYVIHGTNKPYGIGRRVSSGCIRLYPEDIEKLFDEIEIGTPVTVVDQAVKLGWADGELYMEIHPTVAEGDQLEEKGWYSPTPVPGLKDYILAIAGKHSARIDWPAVARAEQAKRGIPVRITR